LSEEMCGVRVVEEHEDKFEVDPDWVMPQLMGLVPDGGRLDQEVRTPSTIRIKLDRAKPCSKDPRITRELAARPFPRQAERATPTIKPMPGARHRSWDVIAVTPAAMAVTDHWRGTRQLDDLERDLQPDGTSCRSFTDRPSGSCGAGGARVADGRYCLPAVEPDAGGESLVKPVRAQRLPDLSYQLGLPLPL
jgi:hypothetical protein